MPMTTDEMVLHMQHPAIDLDFGGLSRLTGLDRRNARRLGREDRPVPPELEAWLRRRVQADPEARHKPSFSAWLERRPGSDPPPWLSPHPWRPPEAPEAVVVEDRRPGRFT